MPDAASIALNVQGCGPAGGLSAQRVLTAMDTADVLRWAPEDQMTWLACGSVATVDSDTLEVAVGKIADRPGIYRARMSESRAEPWHFFYVDETGDVQDSGAASHIF